MEEIQVILCFMEMSVRFGDSGDQSCGKKAMVHIDLIAGLSAKEISVIYRQADKHDGIITTKPALVRRAKDWGDFAVLRFLWLIHWHSKYRKSGNAVWDIENRILLRCFGWCQKLEESAKVSDSHDRRRAHHRKRDVIAALSVGRHGFSTNQDVWNYNGGINGKICNGTGCGNNQQPGAFCSMKKKSAVWHRKSLRSIFQNRAGWSMIRGNLVHSLWRTMNQINASAADYCGDRNYEPETAIVWDKNTGKPVYNAIVWQCRRTELLWQPER